MFIIVINMRLVALMWLDYFISRDARNIEVAVATNANTFAATNRRGHYTNSTSLDRRSWLGSSMQQTHASKHRHTLADIKGYVADEASRIICYFERHIRE